MTHTKRRAAPWTIGEPQPLYWPPKWWRISVTDGEGIPSTIRGPSPEVCLDRARKFVAAMQGDSQTVELTINDLALALCGVQHGEAWWAKDRPHTDFRRNEIAKYASLNGKLSTILDRFSLPRNEEGEVPDNGDDVVRLTWTRPSPPLASQEE